MSQEPSAENPGSDLTPCKAAVVPRARRSGSDAALPIDRLILPLVQAKAHGLVVITSGPGGGKTTAIKHLRAVLPVDWPIEFYDTQPPMKAHRSSKWKLVIFASSKPGNEQILEAFELCPWTLDDCLEYLVAQHRQQCSSVLSRLKEDRSLPAINGVPQLLTLVMDAMAGDSSLTIAREILCAHIEQLIPSVPGRDGFVRNLSLELNIEQHRWLRHDIVRKIRTACWVADELSHGVIPELLTSALYDLISEIAAALRSKPSAIECLQQVVNTKPLEAAVPMAASILLRVDPNWRPVNGRGIRLSNAELANARWCGVDLSDAFLNGANLSGADLSGSNLVCAIADGANLSSANLHGARLDRMSLENANLESADLSEATASQSVFSHSDLDGANLSHATFNDAMFSNANMENADCRWANFSRAHFVSTSVGGADLESTNFAGAMILGVDMTEAKWAGASFPNARVRQCNLEGLELPYANFLRADLTGSLLTGSRIPGGNFRGANFHQAGLADIDWENADLRDADFTYASFHLG